MTALKEKVRMKREIKIVALSDTHGHHRAVNVPDGDVLVFAGDLMTCGRKFSEVRDFADWFNKQPHDNKILIAGNHDHFFEHSPATCIAQFQNVHYLNDSGINIRGWNFWGSPIQPWFCNWAFNRYRGPDIKKHWDKIPDNTDILITHGPPYGFGDYCNPMPKYNFAGDKVGCYDLLDAVKRVKPIAHYFGHIHGGRGIYIDHDIMNKEGYPVHFDNVSICNEAYEPEGSCHTLWLGERE
jgi:Icc-related predicted phosphoesterase